ncbi:MAG: NusA-like transcription termination signal-binding factor [Candidatus Bathyarchaeota archaeon]|nr:NusA-like transcription termination signal-binding factor [Candidatus Bathyarchaeota archaeon]
MLETKIRLGNEEMRYIALFESITGATSEDCLIDEENERIIFIAKKGEMGLAIGKNGKNIDTLRKMTSRQIEVVENAKNPEEMIKNSLSPARIKNMRITDNPKRKIAVVEVEPKDKAIAIGRNGKTIEKTRMLVKRYFLIDHVVIA